MALSTIHANGMSETLCWAYPPLTSVWTPQNQTCLTVWRLSFFQDALLVRVSSGGYEGWGECEASPLTSIAGWVAPMSHSACKPVRASVLGQPLNDVADIYRIGNLVRAESQDVLQADHTFTSHLALSASLQPYAGLEAHEICESSAELKSLAMDITESHLDRDQDGYGHVPNEPESVLAPRPHRLPLGEVEAAANSPDADQSVRECRAHAISY